MLFEVLVLALTVLNALDRPRGAQLPVVKALYRDGIIYFVVSIFPTLVRIWQRFGVPRTNRQSISGV